MTRVMPKAYLRIDPNIDQTHPDNLDEFVRLLCAANRQPYRGRFRNRAVLTSLLGKGTTARLYARGDVADVEGDGVVVPGWETWQEGDLNVGERVRRFRDRHSVTGRSTAVTEPLPDRYPTSDALGRSDVRALSPSAEGDARPTVTNGAYDAPETEAVAWLARHGASLSETNGIRRKLIGLVERFGSNAVIGKFDRLARAGVMDGDARGFVFGAEDALFPKADLKGMEAAERAEETHRASDARYQATQAELRRMRGEN